jgi:hypothetical protein
MHRRVAPFLQFQARCSTSEMARSIIEMAMIMQTRFHRLYANMLHCLCSLPKGLGKSEAPALDALLRLTAAYVPYYQNPGDVLQALLGLPSLSTDGSDGETQIHDYIVTEIALLLHVISSVKGLLRYLNGLAPLLMHSDEWKLHIGMVPLLRLQGELYSLTLPGGPRCGSRTFLVLITSNSVTGHGKLGCLLAHSACSPAPAFTCSCMTMSLPLACHSQLLPITLTGKCLTHVDLFRYCPSRVRSKAMTLLDHAFPVGSQSRGMVRLLFRLMHPSDWPMLVWHWLRGVFSWLRALVVGWFTLIGSLVLSCFNFCFSWLPWRSQRAQEE